MRRVKILELGMKGTNFDSKVPAGTEVRHINEGLALFIIDMAKYRGIKPARALAEIQAWVAQLEDNQ
jgi:hypothetical protein